MDQRIKLTKKQAWPIVSQVFPRYTGRKFSVTFTEKITFIDTNWSGGTRSEYKFIRTDGQTASYDTTTIPPWANPMEGKTVLLPGDIACVVHTIFCGHDVGIEIYAHPCNAPKWLEA
jgi:hypothetical protein